MKKMFKYFGLAGIVGLLTLLFWVSSPASAQDGTVVTEPTSVPAVVGDVDVTFIGTNLPASVTQVAIVPCPGAGGDETTITAGNAISFCPTILNFLAAGNGDVTDGSLSVTISIPITQADIDAGALALTVAQAPLAAGNPSWPVAVAIGGTAAAEEDTDAGEAEEEGTDTDEDVDAEEGTDIDEPVAEPLEDDDDGAALADTGLESGLLAVAGISIVVAGLLFAGFSRRIRK